MNPLADFLLEQILKTDGKNQVMNLEDNKIEYKHSFDWSDKSVKQKCIKELAALSNAGGGYLIYGVEDKSGEIVGESSTEDLANIADFFGRHFSPVVRISGRTYSKDGVPVFVLYAEKYEIIPCVCIKEFEGARNGTLLYRYASKSEPIKGQDLINLLQQLNRDNASEKLLEEQQKNRRNDLMPKFEWNSGGSYSGGRFQCSFINRGATARVVQVISYKHSEAIIDNACSSQRDIEKGQEWMIFGNYKGLVGNSHQNTYAFRLYYTDSDQNLYYSDFEGEQGKVKKKYPLPVASSNMELEEFKVKQGL